MGDHPNHPLYSSGVSRGLGLAIVAAVTAFTYCEGESGRQRTQREIEAYDFNPRTIEGQVISQSASPYYSFRVFSPPYKNPFTFSIFSQTGVLETALQIQDGDRVKVKIPYNQRDLSTQIFIDQNDILDVQKTHDRMDSSIDK